MAFCTRRLWLLLAGSTSLTLTEDTASVTAGDPPFLACRGTDVIKADTWNHVKFIAPAWVDLDLKDARVLAQLWWAIAHNQMYEEHVQDCGFGVASIILASLRAIDYDSGSDVAEMAYVYLQQLLPRLEPYKALAVERGWDWNGKGEMDTTDLVIFPFLLGMEKQHNCYGTRLKIFVYTIGDLARGVVHCQAGQWGLEALVPYWIRQGSCFTEDPEEADFFLVQWHTWCDRMVFRMNQTRNEISNVYLNMMRRREEMLPHWSRNQGRDHIFIFSDQGMNFFPEWYDHIPHSVFLMTEGLTPGCGPSCYNPWKDVILPGHTDYFRYRRMAAWNKPSEERELLFNFHGRHPGLHHFYKDNVVRGKIIELFSGKLGVSVGGFVEEYFEIMGSSHFCLVPMGTSSWTNHLYEAFFAGCIPVILSDDFEVPFQEFLDWPTFSIKWPMLDIGPRLHKFLADIPAQMLKDMKTAVDKHACWFDYHQTYERPGEACSPYLGTMRSLERRKRMLHKLPGPFWRTS